MSDVLVRSRAIFGIFSTVRANSGWNDVHQIFSVAPNRTYKVSGRIRTSDNNSDGYFGVRSVAGQVVVGVRRGAVRRGHVQEACLRHAQPARRPVAGHAVGQRYLQTQRQFAVQL